MGVRSARALPGDERRIACLGTHTWYHRNNLFLVRSHGRAVGKADVLRQGHNIGRAHTTAVTQACYSKQQQQWWWWWWWCWWWVTESTGLLLLLLLLLLRTAAPVRFVVPTRANLSKLANLRNPTCMHAIGANPHLRMSTNSGA